MVTIGASQPAGLVRWAARAATAAAPVVSIGALWLCLAAIPVSADGGPHVAGVNNGSVSLNADSCAGCHRAHSAAGPYLINATSVDGLCLTCHGSAGAGATTDVMLGIQFRAAGVVTAGAQDETDPTVVAGALRGGGFAFARIGSGSDPSAALRPSRLSYPRFDGRIGEVVTRFSTLVPVLPAGSASTSAHLDLDGVGGVVGTGTAWGNAPLGTPGAGPTVELGCTSCHNPHGNGRYRILNPIPDPPSTSGSFTPLADPGVDVTDAPLPPAGDTRNYTVIPGALVGDTGSDPSAGDYWRSWRPWDGVPTYDPLDANADSHGIVPATGSAGDQPSGTVGVTWRTQITAWCAACHTRYPAPRSAVTTPSGDAIFTYRHQTNDTECTQCHVAHGSNAAMPGDESSDVSYPDGSISSSSRLLKIDNRGTCQACHDPTGTVPYTGVLDNP